MEWCADIDSGVDFIVRFSPCREAESFIVVPGTPQRLPRAFPVLLLLTTHVRFSILLSSLCVMWDAHVTILHLSLIVLEIFVLQKAV